MACEKYTNMKEFGMNWGKVNVDPKTLVPSAGVRDCERHDKSFILIDADISFESARDMIKYLVDRGYSVDACQNKKQWVIKGWK